MKLTFFYTILLFLVSCSTTADQQQIEKDKRLTEKEFKIVSSRILSWNGGIKGVKGYNLYFDVVGSNLDKIIIDSVWFYEDKAFKPAVKLEGDTLHIEGSYSESKKVVFRDLETGETKTAEKVFNSPILYKGDALIKAFYKEEEKYFIIDSLIKTENTSSVEVK